MYQLPTDPNIISTDPLGVCDIEDPIQADVLAALLESVHHRLSTGTSPGTLITSLVEDIAYTIHGHGSLDTGNLRRFLADEKVPSFPFETMLKAAMRLATCFPTHHLTTLDERNVRIVLNGSQVDALLAHQFLGTLSQPTGNTWGRPDFTCWFPSEPAHHEAVNSYLKTIISHFAESGYDESDQFVFTLHTAKDLPDPSQCNVPPKVHLQVIAEEHEPSNSKEEPYILVAANSQPGPGPTATQEERLQSASPALSLSALVILVMPDEAAVITSAFPVHAAWKGHNRTARLNCLFPTERRPRRHYLVADALQIDEVQDEDDKIKDLAGERPKREMRKLYAAFRGAMEMPHTENAASCVVEASAWGCGAFGGNIVVKTICMMVAAGLAGVELRLTLLEHRGKDVKRIQAFMQHQWTTATLWDRLTHSQTSKDLENAFFAKKAAS